MKLTFIFLISACLQVHAGEGYGQKITLSQKNISLAKVFNEIRDQSGYLFLYNNKQLDNGKRVTIEVKNASIDEVLKQSFKDQLLTYAIVEKTIVVMPKEIEKMPDLVPEIPLPPPPIEIHGRVVNQQGQPLQNVSVLIVGTKVGTATNNDGHFTLSVPDDKNIVLEISSVGYQTKRVNVGKQTEINVTLELEISGLSDVVVVGYGTQKKKDLTGAVGVISAENLKDRAAVNFGEAMAGQLAGVQVQQITGAPGGEGLSIRIRGTGSITQSNSPLFVVDGYPMEGGAFRLINPSDIQSLQILKDASSTAIYGSRGANGVVIITTKKGKPGRNSISLNIYKGIQKRTRIIPMMNRDEYVQWYIDGHNQAWLDMPVIPSDPDQSPHTINDPNSRRILYPSASTLYMIPDGQGGYKYNFLDPQSVAKLPDNNWQDLIFRNAIIEQYELTASGGNDKTTYAVSGSYLKQDGIVLGSNYERFNFRNNVESNPLKRLKIGMNLNAYYGKGREQVNGKYGPVQFALQLPPIFEVRNSDGTYGSMVRNPEVFVGDVSSPIGVAELVQNHRTTYGWLGTIYGELELLDNLKYRININGSIQDNNLVDFEPSNVDLDASRAPRPAKAYNERSTNYDWVIEQTVNYTKTFASRHEIVLLGGFSSQKHNNDYIYGESRGFPNDNIQTLNAGTMYQLTSTKSDYSMVSYFGRANYDFDNRYLFTATIRSDGSSRFGIDKKWGVFPSGSAAWRISQENFLKNSNIINDLKLRVSYGIAGNNRIGNYSSIGLLSTGFYPTGDALQNTVNPSTIPNNVLGWERVQQSDIGLDIGLFNNRIRLEADFYKSKSLDLLLNVQVPTITGYSSQIQNIGKVLNQGVELLLNTRNLIGKFKWFTDFNIAFNKNKVLELGPDGRPIFSSAPNASNAFITQIGSPIASIYGYVYQGVFMTQKELDDFPHRAVDKVGDGHYLDVNGDGKLDQTDKAIIGNNQPKFTGGFSNNFNYKNFSLSTQLTFSYGAQLLSLFERMVGIYHGDRNAMIKQVNRWRSVDQPGDGISFRATRNPTGWQRDPSSAWITNGSYLRVRNITLAYDFDQSKIRSLLMKNLRLYITGQNLFTWTKYPGYDPETSSEGDGLTKGADYAGYPTAKSIILGLNLTF